MSGTVIPRYYPERSVIIGSLMGTLVSFTAGIGVLRSRRMRGVVSWVAPYYVPPHARPGVPLPAGVLQIPTKLLRARVGRVPLMLAGLLAFVALALLILLLGPAQLGRFTALVPIYLLQGFGRSCYEGINKALYADMFPNDAAAAFSNIVIFNGGASAVAYYVYPLLQDDPDRKNIKAVTALVPAVLTVFTYLAAEALHRRRPESR